MRAFLIDTDVPTPVMIPGKPFQAEFERVLIQRLSDGQVESYVFKGSIYRATDSRVRKEIDLLELDGTITHMIIIQDTLDESVHVLHATSKTVTSFPLTENLLLNSGISRSSEDIDLGERSIEGLLCHGYSRGTRGTAGFAIFWFSDELGEALIAENIYGQDEDTLRLFNIRQDEPDPDFFLVPEDYRSAYLDFDSSE